MFGHCFGTLNPNTVDIGIAAYGPGGNKLKAVWWGSSQYDSINDIAVDPDGNVYVTGILGEECFLYKFAADARSW